ncbi:MAG TPA: cytochrome c peroxidase, partial [Saprospiraceae bacterium]|nr:cytochrome c peroxidase [Saprospiraceae bacterium]
SNFSFNWNEPEIIRVEDQLHIPLFNDAPKELGLKNHEAEILHRFCSDSSYVYLFLRAFPEKAFPINFNNIIKSLAAFCLSIKSYNSDNDKGILTINAQKGKTLFYSEKYNCNNCHSGPNFNQFIGAKRPEDNFQKFGFSETGNKFRIPSLRNLSFTSPYLHDGSAESLLDVLNDYENANRYRNFGQRDVQDSSILTIQTKLDNQMSMEDKMNIIAFLLSLNDTTFVNNPQYKNPFNY